ncbi:MAG: hypothetical protein QMC96_12540 [Methanomicrobiales archaeon]|nr:hypothetical protein [Methanomicrobiales archaeon]
MFEASFTAEPVPDQPRTYRFKNTTPSDGSVPKWDPLKTLWTVFEQGVTYPWLKMSDEGEDPWTYTFPADGVYRVHLKLSGGGETGQADVEITIGNPPDPEPQPEPQPGPGPEPEPGPAPQPGPGTIDDRVREIVRDELENYVVKVPEADVAAVVRNVLKELFGGL